MSETILPAFEDNDVNAAIEQDMQPQTAEELGERARLAADETLRQAGVQPFGVELAQSVPESARQDYMNSTKTPTDRWGEYDND